LWVTAVVLSLPPLVVKGVWEGEDEEAVVVVVVVWSGKRPALDAERESRRRPR
jgi:hypothetical protein